MRASLDRPGRREAALVTAAARPSRSFLQDRWELSSAGRGPSGAGPQVPHSLCGQRDAGSNLDLDGMIEAAENLPHAVNRVWRIWIDHRIDLFYDSRRKRDDFRATDSPSRTIINCRSPGRREAAVGHCGSHGTCSSMSTIRGAISARPQNSWVGESDIACVAVAFALCSHFAAVEPILRNEPLWPIRS